MEKKIKILFYTLDEAGVNYFRIQTPATELDRNHSDEFYVEINNQLDFNNPETIDYLKSFDIIHYHRQLHPDVNQMKILAKELKDADVKLVIDLDDFWELHSKHPMYHLVKEKKLHLQIIENIKIADYVTTTTDLFGEEIKKITKKDNVGVFYNAVNPEWMVQFQNNWKPDPDGKVRITYAGGSSHLSDIEQLEGVFNMLSANPETKDKFKIILAGWDCNGSTTDIQFNENFGQELRERKLWTPEMVKNINKSRGNVDLISKLPSDLKNKYRNNIFKVQQRSITSEESVYFAYERILTDNHKIIENKDYLQWLMNFERNVNYFGNEDNFKRVWTQKANIYAKVLDETDIVIAPLADHKFNNLKSNLKQIECWSRKLPIVCTDIPPYNVNGKHMENCILIPPKKNQRKDWYKYLKRLILNPDLRKKLGEQLYEDFKEEYHLSNVTKDRTEFYKQIIEYVK